MVDVPGAEASNSAPPTLALLALALVGDGHLVDAHFHARLQVCLAGDVGAVGRRRVRERVGQIHRRSVLRRRGGHAQFAAHLVGQSVSRVEDIRLLRGDGRYVADVDPPGVIAEPGRQHVTVGETAGQRSPTQRQLHIQPATARGRLAERGRERDLDALQNVANLDVPSILSLYKLDFLLQDYLATGGMLAASTPAISLMLIYGSAITATHLASRFQGGDFVDEKISSPDVLRPAPALAMSPILEHAPLRGTTTTGADNVLWRADVGQSVQRDLSSRQRVAEEASQQFTSGLASAAATSASRSGETFDGRVMGWSYESSGSQTDRALLQEAESLTHRYAESGLSSQQFAAALSAGIGASNKSDRGALTEAIKGVLRGGGTLTGTYATNEPSYRDNGDGTVTDLVTGLMWQQSPDTDGDSLSDGFEHQLGSDLLGSGIDFELPSHLGAGAYICGEETALLESLEGKKGQPRFKPPFPANFGLYGKPTTINNTETLASVPAIMRKGADWFLDTLVDGDRRVPTVEGQQRQHVEHPDEDVEHGEEVQHPGQPAGFAHLVGDVGDAVQGGRTALEVGVVGVGQVLEHVRRVDDLDDALQRLPGHRRDVGHRVDGRTDDAVVFVQRRAEGAYPEQRRPEERVVGRDTGVRTEPDGDRLFGSVAEHDHMVGDCVD